MLCMDAVPQRMRRDARRDTGLTLHFLECLPQRRSRDRTLAGRAGAQPALVAMGLPQLAQLGMHRRWQRHAPFFVALPDHADQSTDAINRRDLQRCSLADAQAARIHQQETDASDRLPDATDDGAGLGVGQNTGQPPALRRADSFFENSGQSRSSVRS